MAQAHLVLTLGLHGSASTWAYNVARELMAAVFGADAVAACFASRLEELLADRGTLGRRVVCKTHGFPSLDVFAHLTQARVIATVRDPRDAVVSLMQRFASPLDVAVRAVAEDCRQAAWCAAAGHLVLRYEDGFFEQPAAVQGVARHLGLGATDADIARIFAAYRTAAVRSFAAGVASLPPERLVSDGRAFLFDRVTQIHRTHIGDGRIGKWREAFDAERQGELTRLFTPFLTRFGYPPG